MTRTETTRQNVVQGVFIGLVITTFSYVVAALAGWVEVKDLSGLEVFAVFTSYWCTWLCVKQRRINYPIGAASNAAYSWLFWQNDLVASSATTGFLTLWLVYGWFRWRPDRATRPVTHVTLKMVPVYLGIGLAAYFVALQIVNALDGALATYDVLILVGSVIAQTLLDNKKLETWAVWAVVNVLAIYVYFTSDLFLVGFQYIFFLANTIYGWVEWTKSKRASDAEAAAPVQAPLVTA